MKIRGWDIDDKAVEHLRSGGWQEDDQRFSALRRIYLNAVAAETRANKKSPTYRAKAPFLADTPCYYCEYSDEKEFRACDLCIHAESASPVFDAVRNPAPPESSEGG